MKKVLLYLISIQVLNACSDEIPEYHESARAKRVVLAYMAANSPFDNIDACIMKNLQWMYESLSTAKDTCTLMVYYKPSNKNQYIKTAEILEFQTDGYGKINGQEILQGSSQTIESVIAQAKHHQAQLGIATNSDIMKENLRIMQDIAPAESYGLILGSHATGWLPSTNAQYSRSFGIDGDTSNAINIPELATTLEQSFPSGNLEFTLFDACMMGTAEVFYELRNATHYCVASVMETPIAGFPYDRFFINLYEDVIDYAKICSETAQFNKENNWWGTYAAVDCTAMGEVAQAIQAELLSHQSELQTLDYTQVQQYGYGEYRYQYFSFDVVDFISQLNGGVVSANVQSSINKAVIAKDCLDGEEYPLRTLKIAPERFCGMGMYFPGRNISYTWDRYCQSSIAWYNAAGWDKIQP